MYLQLLNLLSGWDKIIVINMCMHVALEFSSDNISGLDNLADLDLVSATPIIPSSELNWQFAEIYTVWRFPWSLI